MNPEFAAGFRAALEAAAKKCDGLAALNDAYSKQGLPGHPSRVGWFNTAWTVYTDAARVIRALPVPDVAPSTDCTGELPAAVAAAYEPAPKESDHA
jgi:hypothetical protein